VNELETRLAVEATRKDFDEAVAAVKGETTIGNEFVKVWLDLQARRDPNVTNAWLNRKADPATYNREVGKLARKFHAEIASQMLDASATADRQLVTAAVRGATTSERPSAPPTNYKKMSDAEFRQHVRDEYGFTPSV
jgi:hypothetical protein